MIEEFKLPPIPNIGGAIGHVLEHDAKYGTEMFIALTATGEVKAMSGEGGTSEAIQIPVEAEGCFLVHNHPIAAPLSISDVLVTNTRGLLGVLCASRDGMIAWSSGGMDDTERGYYTLQNAACSPAVHAGYRECARLGGEHYAGIAANWLALESMLYNRVLKDLYIKSGTDTNSHDLAKRVGCVLPSELGWVNDKVNTKETV